MSETPEAGPASSGRNSAQRALLERHRQGGQAVLCTRRPEAGAQLTFCGNCRHLRRVRRSHEPMRSQHGLPRFGQQPLHEPAGGPVGF